MAASAPALTVKTNPVPGVEIYWSSLPSGTDYMTVYRTADGVTTPVRNAQSVAVSGSYSVTDFEAPFGINVTYTAETFVGGVSGGISASATTMLDTNAVIIQDPLDPNRNVYVVLGGGDDYMLGTNAFATITRPVVMNKSRVIGRSKPVAQFYGRKGIEGIELDVLVDNDKFGVFNELLDLQPLLIRAPGVLGNLPRNLYCVIQADEIPLDWHATNGTGLTRFTLVVDEVESQSTSIIVNVFTYVQYEAKYLTYADAATVYGAYDYTNVDRNPLA